MNEQGKEEGMATPAGSGPSTGKQEGFPLQQSRAERPLQTHMAGRLIPLNMKPMEINPTGQVVNRLGNPGGRFIISGNTIQKGTLPVPQLHRLIAAKPNPDVGARKIMTAGPRMIPFPIRPINNGPTHRFVQTASGLKLVTPASGSPFVYDPAIIRAKPPMSPDTGFLPNKRRRLSQDAMKTEVTASSLVINNSVKTEQQQSQVKQEGEGQGQIEKPKKKSYQMRLRCRSRPFAIQQGYIVNNEIIEKDADVEFICGVDGGRVKGHKLILAGESTFFTDMFKHQQIGEISFVSVPDISSEIMKIVVLLAYKSSVIITADQKDKIKESMEIFGIGFDNFAAESVGSEHLLDVMPATVILPAEGFRKISPLVNFPPTEMTSQSNFGNSPPPPRKIIPSFTSTQLAGLSQQKKKMSQSQQNIGPTKLANIYFNNQPQQSQSNFRLHRGAPQAVPPNEFKTLNHSVKSYTGKRKNVQIPLHEQADLIVSDIERLNAMYEDSGFPEADENIVKEWADSVGKIDLESAKKSVSAVQSPISGVPNVRMCKVCGDMFQNEVAWKWHEERHVSMNVFKCRACEEHRSSVRAIWFHERGEHGAELSLALVEGTSSDSPIKTKVSNPKQSPGNSVPQKDAKQIEKSVFGRGRKGANDSIPIGEDYGEIMPNVDQKKFLKLHWLYVCAKCNDFTDTFAKAQAHYASCYPDGDPAFESTVKKYKQGYYGKCQCPMCPRKFVSNTRFALHSRHSHPQLSALFSSIRLGDEDALSCVKCQQKFDLPPDFYQHLQKDLDDKNELGLKCEVAPPALEYFQYDKIDDDVKKDQDPAPTPEGEEEDVEMATNTTTSTESSSAPPPEQKSEGDKEEEKDTPTVEKATTTTRSLRPSKSKIPTPTATPTRKMSQRVAKLQHAVLMKKVLKNNYTSDEEDNDGRKPKKTTQTYGKRKRSSGSTTTNARASTSNGTKTVVLGLDSLGFPEAECPICGSEVANISEHLGDEHKEINVSVTRISKDLLRCKKCRITFAICDLLSHPANCSPPSSDNTAENANVS